MFTIPSKKKETKLPKTGDVIWQYQIDEILGEGAFGIVYRAHHLSLPRKVAIKRLKIETDQDMVDAFIKEAWAMTELQHPNLILLFEMIDPNKYPNVDSYYMVMDYLAGGTLRHWMKEERLTTLPDIVGVIQQVLHGLAMAHQQKVYHRDIKPENILLSADGSRVVVTDWGLSHLEGIGPRTLSGAIIGTLAYMSPEQAGGHSREVDARSDLYSVGAVLYEITAGRQHHDFDQLYQDGVMAFRKQYPSQSNLFHQAGMEAVLKAICELPPTDPLEHNPSIPPALRAVLLKSLALRPEDRFQSAGEFIVALDGVLNAASIPARSTMIDERVSKVASLLVEARELSQHHKYTQAVQLLNQAREILPEDIGACIELARIYNLMGNQKDALAVLLAASKKHIDSYILWRDLGLTYMALKDNANALQALETSLRLNPNQPRIEKLLEKLRL